MSNGSPSPVEPHLCDCVLLKLVGSCFLPVIGISPTKCLPTNSWRILTCSRVLLPLCTWSPNVVGKRYDSRKRYEGSKPSLQCFRFVRTNSVFRSRKPWKYVKLFCHFQKNNAPPSNAGAGPEPAGAQPGTAPAATSPAPPETAGSSAPAGNGAASPAQSRE